MDLWSVQKFAVKYETYKEVERPGSMKMSAHRPEINPEMKENTDQKTLHSNLLVELQIHSSRSQIREEGIFGILFS